MQLILKKKWEVGLTQTRKRRGRITGKMTENLTYAIKLTYDPEYRGWVADCLNLYGCMSQGKTKEEALENIEKAIKAYMRAAV